MGSERMGKKQPWFERVFLRAAAPGWASRRIQRRAEYDVWASGYEAATDTRRRQNRAFGRSVARDEDRHVGEYDRQKLLLECRDLWRNNGIVDGALEMFAGYVLPPTLRPQARTSSPDWNAEAEAFAGGAMRIADARGREDFEGLAEHVVRARLDAGDCAFVKVLETGQLQPVESERIATPRAHQRDSKVRCGVRVGRTGRIAGFYICGRNDRGMVDTSGRSEYRAREQMLFCRHTKRFDQVRGMPDLGSVINMLRDIGEFEESTLFKAKLDAKQAWQVLSERGMGPAHLRPRGGGTEAASGDIRVEKTRDGTFWYPGANGKVESLASKTPNAQFDPFMRWLLTWIGAALRVPWPILLMDPRQFSFSVTRGALVMAYHTFGRWNRWLKKEFLHPWWNWRIGLAMERGELSLAPVDKKSGVSEYWKVDWGRPRWEWVDPTKEVLARRDEWNMGATSLTEWIASRGGDRDEVFRSKGADLLAAHREAQRLNAEAGADLFTWRHIVNADTPGVPVPGGESAAESGEVDEEEPGEDANEG